MRFAWDRPDAAGVAEAAQSETERVEGARPFRWLIRAGFIARAITYAVIGALALAIALGAGTLGNTPNQQGALSLIAHTAIGRPALVVIAAGLAAYAVWKLTQAIFGHGPEGGGGTDLKDRVANLAAGLVYLVFFWIAVRTLTGTSGNSSSEPRHTARGVLSWPGGELIVGIAGGVLLATSLYQVYEAVRGRFAQDSKTQQMSSREHRLFMVVGRVGLTARALVFVPIGYYLLRTAIDSDPADAIGLDGALARLHQQPLGRWLVAIAGAGLLTFAVFSLIEGRYRRL